MREDSIALAAPLFLALGLMLAPTAASTEELRDRRGEAPPGGSVATTPGGFVAAPPGFVAAPPGFVAAPPSFPRPSAPQPVPPHRFPPHGPFRPSRFPGAVYPFGPYDSPGYYYPSPGSDPPFAYTQPGAVPVAPSPPPTPDVIEYPTGRYELRGDGVSVPYAWVWVPKPPPPPEAAPPETPETPPEQSAPADRSPTPHEAYRWTDDQGSVYWTDRWDSIPEQYRAQAKRLSL